MSRKLFVGGLSWGTTDEELSQAFQRFGEVVEATVIRDRDTGRSRGFGFVTFAQDEEADKALAEMNGTDLGGRTIRVDKAADNRRDRGRPGEGGGGRREGGGGRSRDRT